MHLDEERLQRLAHGQLEPHERAMALEHIEACGDCRRLLEAARREDEEVAALLGALDSPGPAVDARSIAARARGVGNGSYWRWAASIALAVGIAGAAYAWPGSPLPRWVSRALAWVGVGEPGRGPAPSGAERDESSSGIAVAPGDDFLILFTNPDGIVRVTLVESGEVVVRASVAATAFTSEANRIVIDNRATSATFEIQIPQAAPRVEIRAGDRTIFLKEGSRTLPDVPSDSLLRLTPSGP